MIQLETSIKGQKETNLKAGGIVAKIPSSIIFADRKIVIPNSYGEKLVGTLHETGSDKIVILCHGFKSTKDHDTISKLASALEKDGNTVFRFDFSGNGESEGTFEYANYWREAEDLRVVVEHFKEENRLISTILGHSKGGNVVLLYASKYHDIPSVVNVSGRYNLKGGIVERLGKDIFEEIEKDGFFDVKNREGDLITELPRKA